MIGDITHTVLFSIGTAINQDQYNAQYTQSDCDNIESESVEKI
jgi:hypothetical protein